ncbi:hypothetical protein [Methylobacterium soli]|uniref:Uncharacterized protein n=1 Tax=Methylobacterium soli TaxID=553447 RepID=A0A6L3SSM9_9HYPH|nr:hypothetical protein [Methylobacterium soli]KAB1070363.1 hypothetical protein F6X53_30160 [Methylobacterium soli]
MLDAYEDQIRAWLEAAPALMAIEILQRLNRAPAGSLQEEAPPNRAALRDYLAREPSSQPHL